MSDHRPVALKLSMDSNVGVDDFPAASMHFTNYPNPFNSETTFSFVIPDEPAVLEIVNVQGQMVYSEKMPPGTTSIKWDAVRNWLAGGVGLAPGPNREDASVGMQEFL